MHLRDLVGERPAFESYADLQADVHGHAHARRQDLGEPGAGELHVAAEPGPDAVQASCEVNTPT